MPKVPAKCGLLQVCALSLYSKIQQSVSEIGENLWRILEIFPFFGRREPETGRDQHCVCGTQSRLSGIHYEHDESMEIGGLQRIATNGLGNYQTCGD
jgi:hypothetical protein